MDYIIVNSMYEALGRWKGAAQRQSIDWTDEPSLRHPQVDQSRLFNVGARGFQLVERGQHELHGEQLCFESLLSIKDTGSVLPFWIQ